MESSPDSSPSLSPRLSFRLEKAEEKAVRGKQLWRKFKNVSTVTELTLHRKVIVEVENSSASLHLREISRKLSNLRRNLSDLLDIRIKDILFYDSNLRSAYPITNSRQWMNVLQRFSLSSERPFTHMEYLGQCRRCLEDILVERSDPRPILVAILKRCTSDSRSTISSDEWHVFGKHVVPLILQCATLHIHEDTTNLAFALVTLLCHHPSLMPYWDWDAVFELVDKLCQRVKTGKEEVRAAGINGVSTLLAGLAKTGPGREVLFSQWLYGPWYVIALVLVGGPMSLGVFLLLTGHRPMVFAHALEVGSLPRQVTWVGPGSVTEQALSFSGIAFRFFEAHPYAFVALVQQVQRCEYFKFLLASTWVVQKLGESIGLAQELQPLVSSRIGYAITAQTRAMNLDYLGLDRLRRDIIIGASFSLYKACQTSTSVPYGGVTADAEKRDEEAPMAVSAGSEMVARMTKQKARRLRQPIAVTRLSSPGSHCCNVGTPSLEELLPWVQEATLLVLKTEVSSAHGLAFASMAITLKAALRAGHTPAKLIGSQEFFKMTLRAIREHQPSDSTCLQAVYMVNELVKAFLASEREGLGSRFSWMEILKTLTDYLERVNRCLLDDDHVRFHLRGATRGLETAIIAISNMLKSKAGVFILPRPTVLVLVTLMYTLHELELHKAIRALGQRGIVRALHDVSNEREASDDIYTRAHILASLWISVDDGENLSTFCSLPESIPHVITLLSQLLDGKIPRDRIGDPDSVFLISSVCGISRLLMDDRCSRAQELGTQVLPLVHDLLCERSFADTSILSFLKLFCFGVYSSSYKSAFTDTVLSERGTLAIEQTIERYITAPNVDIRRVAASMLVLATSNQEGLLRIGETVGVRTLLESLHHENDNLVAQLLIVAILNLSANHRYMVEIAKQGLQAFIALAVTARSQHVRTLASLVLGNLRHHKENRTRLYRMELHAWSKTWADVVSTASQYVESPPFIVGAAKPREGALPLHRLMCSGSTLAKALMSRPSQNTASLSKESLIFSIPTTQPFEANMVLAASGALGNASGRRRSSVVSLCQSMEDIPVTGTARVKTNWNSPWKTDIVSRKEAFSMAWESQHPVPPLDMPPLSSAEATVEESTREIELEIGSAVRVYQVHHNAKMINAKATGKPVKLSTTDVQPVPPSARPVVRGGSPRLKWVTHALGEGTPLLNQSQHSHSVVKSRLHALGNIEHEQGTTHPAIDDSLVLTVKKTKDFRFTGSKTGIPRQRNSPRASLFPHSKGCQLADGKKYHVFYTEDVRSIPFSVQIPKPAIEDALSDYLSSHEHEEAEPPEATTRGWKFILKTRIILPEPGSVLERISMRPIDIQNEAAIRLIVRPAQEGELTAHEKYKMKLKQSSRWMLSHSTWALKEEQTSFASPLVPATFNTLCCKNDFEVLAARKSKVLSAVKTTLGEEKLSQVQDVVAAGYGYICSVFEVYAAYSLAANHRRGRIQARLLLSEQMFVQLLKDFGFKFLSQADYTAIYRLVLSQRDKDDAVGVTRAGFLEAILRISFKLSTVLGSVSPDPLRGIEEIILRAKQLASQTARVGGEEYRAVAIYAQETDKVIRVNRKLLEELYSTYASMKRNEEGVSSPNNCHAESSKFLLQEYAALMCLEEWQLFLTHFNVIKGSSKPAMLSFYLALYRTRYAESGSTSAVCLTETGFWEALWYLSRIMWEERRGVLAQRPELLVSERQDTTASAENGGSNASDLDRSGKPSLSVAHFAMKAANKLRRSKLGVPTCHFTSNAMVMPTRLATVKRSKVVSHQMNLFLQYIGAIMDELENHMRNKSPEAAHRSPEIVTEELIQALYDHGYPWTFRSKWLWLGHFVEKRRRIMLWYRARGDSHMVSPRTALESKRSEDLSLKSSESNIVSTKETTKK